MFFLSVCVRQTIAQDSVYELDVSEFAARSEGGQVVGSVGH